MKISSDKFRRVAGVVSLCAGIAVFGSLPAAQAATVYSYQGNNYSSFSAPYDMSMSVSGSFVVPTALAANLSDVDILSQLQSATLFDGITTLTLGNTNSDNNLFKVSTDALGNILNWQFFLTNLEGLLLFPSGGSWQTIVTAFGLNNVNIDQGRTETCEVTIPTDICSLTSNFNGTALNNPGNWTSQAVSTVPLPAALPLYGTGLGILGFLGWRRRRQVVA